MNISILANVTDKSIIGVGDAIDQMSNGLFGLSLVIVIVAVGFAIMLKHGAKIAFSVAATMGAISAIFLRLIGWIDNDIIVFIMIILVGVAAVVRFVDRTG